MTLTPGQRSVIARERGEQVLDLANSIINQLAANGMLVDPNDARVALFDLLADALYGYGVQIDIPTLRRS